METTTEIGDNCDGKLNGGGNVNDMEPSNADIENKTVIQVIPDLNSSENLSAINDSKDIVDSDIVNLNDSQKLISSLVENKTNEYFKSNDKADHPLNSTANNVQDTLTFDSNLQENEVPTGTSFDEVNTVEKDTPDNLTSDITSQESGAPNTVSSDKVDAIERETQESKASNTVTSYKVDDVEKETPDNLSSNITSQESEASTTVSSDKVDDIEKVTADNLTSIYTSQEDTAGNSGDDNMDKMEIVKSENIEALIKEEQEEMIQLHKKFAYKGVRNRKQTELYVATENIRKRSLPPQISEEEPNSPKEDENECGVCKRVFDNKKARFNHERTDHKNDTSTVFKCMQCNTHCDNNQQLRDHKECHSEDTFVCQKCKLAYDNHLNYLTHSIRHYPTQKFYTCEECQKNLFDKTALKSHIQTHYNLLIQCSICNEKVVRQQITQHKAAHNELKCVECGKICKGQSHYTQHMNTHIGFKPYQCLYCGKGYSTSCAKRIHTDTHLGVRKFKCKQCGRQFRQLIDLMRHKETHEGKQFECSHCQKKFLHKQSLQIHMRAHTGDHLLKCPECSQGFTSKTGLRSHIVYAHTRVFSYKCDICDLQFFTKNGLSRHNKSIRHQQKEYAFNNKDK